MTEAIIFDMDGLIFDSEHIVQRSWEDAGNRLGILHMGDHIYHTLGMNLKSRREYFYREVSLEFPQEEFARLTKVRFQEIVEEEGLDLKPGVPELLEYAKNNGYKMAVATSSRSGYAGENLRAANIYGYFDGFVFGDQVQHSKPGPEIYLKACQCIGAEPVHSIALEDSPAGICSAFAAGMRAIMVPDLVKPVDEITGKAFRVFDTLYEVITLLEEERDGKIQM